MLTFTQLTTWFTDAGLAPTLDAVANVRGGAGPPSAPGSRATLVLGSHYDSVVDAGAYDGTLGIVAALAAVSTVAEAAPPATWTRRVEVIAFSEEEGVRFGTTFVGSGAVAGTLKPSGALTTAVDAGGVTLAQALAPATESDVAAAAIDASTVRGYVEAHAEQGPRLERARPPARLAAVSAIAGQTRLALTVTGEAGHAGTVAMRDRRDAGAAAAAAVVAVERACGGGPARVGNAHVGRVLAIVQPAVTAIIQPATTRITRFIPARVASVAATLFPPAATRARAGLVCTVGALTLSPGAPNVIAGAASAVIDVRSPHDADRAAAVAAIGGTISRLCAARRVHCDLRPIHDAHAAWADAGLTAAVETAAAASGKLWERAASAEAKTREPPHSATIATDRLASGAGHDALALARAMPWAMLFVRDEGGVSHTPAERVRDGDVAAAAAALAEVVAAHVLGR